MKKRRTNSIIALLAGAGILLMSISHVAGREGGKAYTAPDLLLTQGQAEYDLCAGIKYNSGKYELSVGDEGGFDINTPGSYTVKYALTPVDQSSGAEEMLVPKDPAAPKETAALQGTPGVLESTAPQDASGAPGTAAPQDASGAPGTAALQGTPGVLESTAPQDTAGAPGTAAPQDAAGAPGTAAPQDASGAPGTAAPQDAAGAPGTAAPQDTSVTSESTASQDTSGTSESAASQGTSGTSESAASQDTSGTSESAASQDTSGTSESAASHDTSVTSNSAASQDTSVTSKPAASQDTSVTSKPAASQDTSVTSNPAASHDTAAAGDHAAAEGGSASGNTSSQNEKSPAQEAQSEQNRTADSAGTVKAQGQLVRPPAINSAGHFAIRAGNEKIILKETAPLSYVATASEGTAVSQGTPEPQPQKASASQANIDGDEIYFTRTVVVKAAVQYENIRLDTGTATDLLTGMNYDESHYRVSVLDDDGFNGSSIGEYHIIYSLVNADNGSYIADLERYIWITAPGVTFDAPELQLRLRQTGYDLKEGISYDSDNYTLTAADPDSIDTSQTGEQRAMFIMRERANADEAYMDGTALSQPESPAAGESPIQPESRASDRLAQPMPSTVSLVPDEEETASYEDQPIAAEFGRDVKVVEGPVVVIDAPPLVIMAGSEAQHSLLEGAAAEDEDGNPVELQVADRSELDQAAGGQAEAAAAEALTAMVSADFEQSENPPENPELPATLPPGTYQVLLAATHPVTGEMFTMRRMVGVTDGNDLGIIRVIPPGAISSGNPVKDCDSLTAALAYITSDGQAGKYTISLQKDYGLGYFEIERLQNFTANATEVVFSGLPIDRTGTVISGAAKSTLIVPYTGDNTYIYLPKNSPVSYTIENMRISSEYLRATTLVAQCSALTMGEGLEISQTFSIWIRGNQTPVNGDANLTIKSGTYSGITGGVITGSASQESGNTYITVEGGVIKSSILGNVSLPLTGDIYITVGGGTVGQIYGNYDAPLIGTVNVTIKGGTVHSIYSNYNNTITGHTEITVEGGSIDTLSGGSSNPSGKITPPDPSERAASITVRGGTIGTLYGGQNYVYGAGSYVELHGGRITNLYGGSQTTYQPAASPADIAVNESGTSVSNIYDFDSLTIADGKTFALSSFMGSRNGRSGLGAIKLGAGSTLRLPATGNSAGTLAVTGAGSKLVLGQTGAGSASLYLYGNTAPDVAAGKITLAYPEGTTPAAGDRLINFSHPSLADANDYIDGIWNEDLRKIYSDQTSGYVYLEASAFHVVPPNAGQAHPVMPFDTAKSALAYITADGQAGSYTISLLKDCTWGATEMAALKNFSAKATEVVFSGLPTDVTGAVVSGAAKSTLIFGYASDIDIYLPENSSVSYTLENMKISSQYYRGTSLIAQCSALTMGEGLEISGTFRVYGRGYNTPVNGDASLTIKSGTYSEIRGGSSGGSSSSESGNSHITVEGGNITAIYGNGYSTLTGDIDITVAAGTVNQIYGNYSAPLIGTANVTIKGGTVNQIYGNYSGSITGHTEITVEGGRIDTLSGGSYSTSGKITPPNLSEKAASVIVRGGSIGTLYGGQNCVYGAGSYVELRGGGIWSLYGGSQTTYQPAESPADIVVSESGITVSNIYNFDSLAIADGKTFTLSSSMSSNNSRSGLGAIKLGAGSTLRLLSAGSTAGTLAVTGADSKLVLSRPGSGSASLYLYGNTAPDVAAGKITLTYPEGTTPAAGDRLIHFYSPSLANANDYIDGIWNEDLKRIYSDQTSGDIYLAASAFHVVPPNAGQAHPVMPFDTAKSALAYITADGQAGSYTVSLLKDCTWGAPEMAALQNFSAKATEVVFSGLPTDATGAVVSGAVKSSLVFGYASDINIYLPENSSVSYTLENIKISSPYSHEISLIAQCSPLTMGEGLEISRTFRVFGRGYNVPVSGDVSLTIKSGTYQQIWGGNSAGSSASESGNSHITVEGGDITAIYGNGGSLLTGDVYVTVKGGTVNQIYGNYSGSITGHTEITVEGGRIDTLSGGSYSTSGKITPPNLSEKAASVIVRGGSIGTLYGGQNYVYGAGSYVELYGGGIWSLYGGSQTTYQPAESPADIVVSESGTSVGNIYDFDSLTIADGKTFALSSSMRCSSTGRSGLGAIKLGAGSTLRLPATSNTAGTLAVTGAGSKLVLGQTGAGSASLYLYGNTAPDVAAGKITLVYPEGTTPAAGDKLIQFSYSALADANDYIDGIWNEDLKRIYSEQTSGYVYLAASAFRVVPPNVGQEHPVMPFDTAKSALAYITADGQEGSYTVSLLKDCTWGATEKAALQNFSAKATEVVFSGLPTDATGAVVSGAAKSRLVFSYRSDIDIYLPKNSSVSYTLENMKISSQDYRGTNLIAQCSALTMGEGLEISGTFCVFGRGYNVPVSGDVSLTIKSGTYQQIWGGNSGGSSASESGNSHITVEGGDITAIYGNGGSLLTGDVYVTVEGGTVNQIYGNYSGAITGHTRITVEGGSISTLSGGSYSTSGKITPPNLSEKAASVIVRGGSIGTLYGGQNHVYGAGSYVELYGGGIWSLYGGSQTTYQPEESPADIVVSESGTSVSNIYDFDSLTIADGKTFVLSSAMGSHNSRSGLGAIKLGAGSTLRLPAAINTAGTLAVTGAGSKLVLGQPGAGSASLYLYGNTAPDVAAGKITLAYPEGTTPAAGDRLINFSSPSLADANDYIDGIWNEDLKKIYSDQTSGDVYLAVSSIRVVPPNVGQEHPVMPFDTIRNALAYITADGQAGSYTISLLKDCTWGATEMAALQNFSAKATEVVFSGLPTDITGVVVSGAAKSSLVFGYASDINIYLPKNSSISYTLENMKISSQNSRGTSLIAQCSALTMGENLEISGTFSVYGRGYNTPVSGDVSLTIKSGTYSAVWGGGCAGSSSERGNSHITVKGGNIPVIYGNGYSSLTGDVYVTVVAGTVHQIYGNYTAPLNGTANITIKGGTVDQIYGNYSGQITGRTQSTVEGGTIGILSGGSYSTYGRITPPDLADKAASVIVRGGTIGTLYGGQNYIYGAGSYVELHGGKVTNLHGAGQTSYQSAESPADIVISESGAVVGSIYNFDSLTVADGQTFAPSISMVSNNNRVGLGAIKLGAGSTLTLPATGNTAGTLITTGAGSKLILNRRGAGSAPLYLNGNTAPDVAAGKITIAYPEGTTPAAGDKLIRFYFPSLADVSSYENGFENISILASKTTGYVYLGAQVTLQTDGGAAVFYSDLAAAMKAIGTGTGDYTIIIRKEGYTVTDKDKAAMAANGTYARSITYASGFTVTDQDPMEADDAIGSPVTRTVNISGDFGTNCPTYLDNIRLNLLSASPSIYADGQPLYVGTQTAPYMKTGTVSMAGHYPDIYGGSETRQVGSTKVVLAAGQYNDIYGGGKNGAVTGDTSLVIKGNVYLYGSIYGGGRAGSVGGHASLQIEGGTARKLNTHLVAGGQQGAAGSASLSISGGTALSTLLVGGAEDGDVAGDVQISVTESSGPVPSAASANIYGTLGTGKVGGAATITINNGKNYGIISGGSLGTGTVAGPRTVNFNDAQVKIGSVRDFDALNLGPEKKTTLTFSGSLSGSGALNFYNGSMLNLPAEGTLRVGSIATYTEGASHLHIGKAAATGETNPLHITGANTSTPANRLTVGFIHDEAGTEKLGDNLLVFDDPANAKPVQYISDTTAFDIIVSAEPGEPGIIEFGLVSTPHIKEYSVRHTNGEGGSLTQPDVAGPTVKTLHVVMTNFGADGKTYAGRPIQSAYVDNAEKADETWLASGTIPAGANAVTVARQPGTADESPAWDGTAVIDVTQPQGETPRCYFIHVRDVSGAADTRALDLESPVNTTGPAVTRDAQGNYTIKITFTDPVLTVPGATADSPLAYTAAGLSQFAWSVGDASGSPGRSEALAADMVTGDHLEVTKPESLDFASYDWTLEIPAEKFGDDPSGKVVYLYAKDKKGNTRELALPMNENLIDVTVPARVGLIALKGGDQRLLKPACYVVNNSPTNAVRAELIGAEIPAGELTFVTKANGFGSNEMNLAVTDEGGDMGNIFSDRSVTDITKENPLNLGIMPPASQQNHGDYFTFDARYDPVNIRDTGSWSLIKFSYRFTLERGTPRGEDRN